MLQTEGGRTVHVLFHQYRQMKRCKPSMYKHFATLISVQPMPLENLLTLNLEVEQENHPWWLSNGSLDHPKPTKKKNQMNKDERKNLNKAITYEYLKNSDKGDHVAEKMAKKLEIAQHTEAEIAAKLNIDVNDMDTAAINTFVNGKRNTLNRHGQRVLQRNHFSVRKISISQSVLVDWRQKAESNASRIREKLRDEKVDVIINADEMFLLFHPFGERLIAPTGVKRVGTVVQPDN